MKSIVFRSIVITALLFLVGCASLQIGLEPVYWEVKEKKIGVAVIELPDAKAYKAGNQGLLDMAINKILAGSLESHLTTLNADSFLKIQDRFIEKINEKGLNAIKIEELVQYDREINVITSQGGKKHFEMDFSFAKDNQLDEILLLFVDRFGTIRKYYGFLPLSNPDGICEARGMLVNVMTNEIIWLADMDEKDSVYIVYNEWNQSPDFPNVTYAIEKAIDRSINFLYKDFFNTN